MADFDTKVLYLENPPLEAPPASYLIGVRMKNLGIEPAATSGFVQVFRKSTGLLVKTFDVASAEMDPDEEKQAFATQSLDLTGETPGEQFIFSGDITSPGDTDRSNDILNPTTITVVDEPPPPPPPVASHASMHEDGGSDELDLTGLHGVLGTPQPYANHAAKHQDEGDDQINVAGLSGGLADPQIPTDHGNERHIQTFATTTLLTNHENDETVHEAATTLEHPTNKGQVDGYAELDGAGKVPVEQLGGAAPGGTDFLKGDQTWATPAGSAPGSPVLNQPGLLPVDGTSTDFARADHQHGGEGGIMCSALGGPFTKGVEHVMATAVMPANFLTGTMAATYEFSLGGIINTDAQSATLTVRIRAGVLGVTEVIRGSVVCSLSGNQTNKSFYASARACFSPGGSGSIGFISHDAVTTTIEGRPWPVGTTGAMDLTLENVVKITIELASTGNPAISNTLETIVLTNIKLS